MSFAGQMLFFAEWNVILYLCSPILTDIATLTFAGLYINDLSMHDFSRDLLLTGNIIIICVSHQQFQFLVLIVYNVGVARVARRKFLN